MNQLCAEKKFANLRGLLYFTDGMGTYPARRPAYDTAFLFLGERFDDANVPPWAMKVVLDEEEFTGAADKTDEDYGTEESAYYDGATGEITAESGWTPVGDKIRIQIK